MKRFLKWTALVLGSLVALIVAVLLLVWYRPGLVLNEKTLAMGAKHLPRFGYSAKWDRATIAIGVDGFWNRSLKLDFDGLCVRAEDGSLDACFKKVDATVAASLADLKFRMTELGPITVLGGDIALEPEKAAKKEPEPEAKSDGEIVPEWMTAARLNPIRVEVDSWRLITKEQAVEGSVKLSNAHEKRGWKWVIDAEESIGRGSIAHRAEANLSVAMEGERWWVPFDGGLRAKAVFKDGRRAGLDAKLGPQGRDDEHAYSVQATWSEGKKRATARAEGRVSSTSLKGTLNAAAHGFVPRAPRIAVERCGYSMERLPGERDLGDLGVDCPVVAKVIFPPVDGIPQFKVPTVSKARLRAQLRSSFPPSMDHPLSGRVRVDLEPILTPLIQGEGYASAELDGVPGEFPKDWKVDSQVDLKLVIPELKKTIAELKDTPWAVPAPLNVLEGRVEMGASGKVDLASAKLPLYLKTRLASKHQKLNLDGSGEFTFVRDETDSARSASAANFDLVLSEVRLALPRLDLEAPPRFFPDARIAPFAKDRAGEADSNASRFDYHLTIRTPQGEPVRIVSNLAKSAVPIALDLKMASGEEPSGTVKIKDFALELFRRKAMVEKFFVNLDPKTGERTVDGSIRVAYADYTIRILVFGLADEPKIKLVSDPPVPEDQLMAVLLFGKELDQLDPDETDSVGQTRAAIYDNAIGLASLYFLASTPVESVGYDPNTGAFNAKVKLGAGTSLNVGQRAGAVAGDDNSNFVGVRRRLSRFWTVTTDVAHSSSSSSGGGGSTASAFLEWSNRY